jgi:P3 major capsid protein
MKRQQQNAFLISTSPFAGARALAGSPDFKMGYGEFRRRAKNTPQNGMTAAPKYSQKDNDQAQAAVLAIARPMIQPTMSQTISGNNAAQGQTVTFNLINVGLQTKVTVEVTGTLTAGGAETLAKGAWGLSNIFSQVVLTDLSNIQRINTTGLHLFALATLRNRSAFGAAFLNDSPVQMGSNYVVNDGPVSLQNGASANFRMFFELPLAYHDNDLRGAIFANVTNAQWRLQLTVNANFIMGSGATDKLFSVYSSSLANPTGVLSNFVIQIYQHYLDNLPRGQNNQPIVPLFSLSWNYLILNTVSTGAVQSQDFPVQYANFRTFLSTIAIFDNGGQFNPGTDVNYYALQVANQTYLEKLDPFMAALKLRQMIGDDFPNGTVVFDHRRWPIVTDQFGNTQFVLNASTVNANASLQMMYEMLSLQNQAINAGSLAAG